MFITNFKNIFLSLLLLWSFSAQSTKDCHSLLGQLSTIESTQSIEALLKDPKLTRLQDWRKFPDTDPKLTSYVHTLLDLPIEQKKLFLHHVNKRVPPLDPRTMKTLGLVLYDDKAWTQYVQGLSERGDYYGFLSGSFLPVIEKMPSGLKEMVTKKVTELYPLAGKNLETNRGLRANPPKRALDLLLRHLHPPEEIIAKYIDEGKSPLEAYGIYLTLNMKVFESVPGIAKYDVSDAMSVYRQIQTFLAASDVPLRDKKILLFGSFPGGRANIFNPLSDVDFYYTNSSLEASFGALKQRIHEELKNKHQNVAFDLSGHWEGDYPSFMAARVSPLQIEITPDSIKLLVFPKMAIPTRNSPHPQPLPVVYDLLK